MQPYLMKVFCIGFQKTGTTSIESAMTSLGFRVCGVRFDLIPGIEAKDYSGIWKVVDSFDAFRDNPWPLLYKELDARYPGSKFILTIRDESSWIRSVINHFNSTPSEMIQLVYSHPFPAGHEEDFIRIFRQHNQDVQDYFSGRQQDLLVLNLSQHSDWDSFCTFLGVPIPPIPFPHQNKGAYTFFGKKIKRFRKKINAKLRSFRNPDS